MTTPPFGAPTGVEPSPDATPPAGAPVPPAASVGQPFGAFSPANAPGQPAPPSSQPRLGLDPAGIRPTSIVAAVIAALFFGSQLVNAVIPASAAPQPTGSATVGQLRIPLAPGWQQIDGPGGDRLAKGGVAIDILNTGFDGDATSLYRRFVDEALAPHAVGFFATEPAAVLLRASGVSAARGAYTGVFGQAGEVEGQLTALVIEQDGYVFDAWGQVGSLGQLLPEVEQMLDAMVAGQ